MQVQMASGPSTTAANNSSVATLLKTSTKTSSAFANSVWQMSSALRVSVYPYISSKTASTVATKRRTKDQSPPTASYSPHPLPTTRSAQTPYQITSASSKTTSAKSSARTTTKPSSKTKTCLRNSASPNLDYRPQVRSPRRANVRSANNNKRRRRSANSRKTRNSRRRLANSNCACRSLGSMTTSRRKSTAMWTAPC